MVGVGSVILFVELYAAPTAAPAGKAVDMEPSQELDWSRRRGTPFRPSTHRIGVEDERVADDLAIADHEVLSCTQRAERAGRDLVHDHGSFIIADGCEQPPSGDRLSELGQSLDVRPRAREL